MPPAKQSLKYTQISQETFNATLSRYPSTVPEKLRELDVLRYDTIPTTVASRAKEGAYLAKDEVEKLVEWKLYVNPSSLVRKHTEEIRYAPLNNSRHMTSLPHGRENTPERGQLLRLCMSTTCARIQVSKAVATAESLASAVTTPMSSSHVCARQRSATLRLIRHHPLIPLLDQTASPLTPVPFLPPR
ncbi:hypothetical protein P171DRAFT_434128 [Karstenula rhodostoma CBS 690.94]|uniref:Uncharacterized protein n=1 Tax=Karstenula rhodostoma CBS 690.94 TaxID=1392251 RepID=A0A9P4U9T9_9PLEO|nr:hypothetical protein P171DRAFT_434128 [Karstenula rhodostoma CBS 690.94]